MNKLAILFLFLLSSYTYVSALPRKYKPSQKLERHLRNEVGKNDIYGRPFDLQNSINYQRQNNYELYVDMDNKLKQYKANVNEPRQILKGNVPDLRYAINDAEIIFKVYPYEPKYEKKILRETLKPASLCYVLTGLLLPKLNEIQIEGAPLYGLIIKGKRNSNNEVLNELEISAILSNTEYPLGTFYFPLTKELYYQIPFLVNFYENKDGYNRRQFSYICSLPEFLIDVLYTSGNGMKFNFNGKEISADQIFPITITYFRDNSKSAPQQIGRASEKEITIASGIIKKIGNDISSRFVTNEGANGKGVEHPLDRILLNASLHNVKYELRQFLDKPNSNIIEQEHVPYYFLLLSQAVLKKRPVKTSSKIAHLDLSDIKKKSDGSLLSFILKIKLENGSTVEVRGSVNIKTQVFLPSDIKEGDFISVDVPVGWGFILTPNGLKFDFCGYQDFLEKLFDYKLNKYSKSVSGILN